MNLEVTTSRLATHHPSWGWEVAVYLFLGGLAAGLLVLRGAMDLRSGSHPRSTALRLAPFLAVALLQLGMLGLFLDLGWKTHLYRFYLAFRPSSPMSWGAWLLVLVVPLALLHGWRSLDERRPLRAVAWLNLVAGIGLGIYTGLLLGTLPAHPLWNSAVLGPLFLVSGLSTGAAFLLLLPLHEEDRHFLVAADVAAIAAELALLALMAVGLSGAGAGGREALAAFLGGAWTPAFWSLVVVAGLLVPLAFELAERLGHRRPVALAPLLVLMGGMALRWILLAAGQSL